MRASSSRRRPRRGSSMPSARVVSTLTGVFRAWARLPAAWRAWAISRRSRSSTPFMAAARRASSSGRRVSRRSASPSSTRRRSARRRRSGASPQRICSARAASSSAPRPARESASRRSKRTISLSSDAREIATATCSGAASGARRMSRSMARSGVPRGPVRSRKATSGWVAVARRWSHSEREARVCSPPSLACQYQPEKTRLKRGSPRSRCSTSSPATSSQASPATTTLSSDSSRSSKAAVAVASTWRERAMPARGSETSRIESVASISRLARERRRRVMARRRCRPGGSPGRVGSRCAKPPACGAGG